MKNAVLSLLMYVTISSLSAQVTEMNWELDYQIYLKMANDSNYTYDIREAFHVRKSNEFTSDYIFYPVNPGKEFATGVPSQVDSIESIEYTTLWNALHAKIGGGWVHFSNCIAYALETQKLSLTAPLMKRPVTNWKPKPVTEPYKRTKGWEFYVPVSQKEAQKEYQLRIKNENAGDLFSLPHSYLELFLSTTQKEYERFKVEGKKDAVAIIDLVKVLLGSNYLGVTQITYISNAILESVLTYSSNMLPSVIIFDEYDAAAVMSLNENGYKLEKVVYRASAKLSDDEALSRQNEIESIVDKINNYNNNSFKQSLGKYYK